MSLYQQFKAEFDIDLRSLEWKIGTTHESYVDINKKIIWKKSLDEFGSIFELVLFPNLRAVNYAFEHKEGEYALRASSKSLYESVNHEWEYVTKGEYLVMRNEAGSMMSVIYISPSGKISAIPSDQADTIYAESGLAKFSKMSILQTTDIGRPTLRLDGTIEYPYRRNGKNSALIPVLVSITDKEVIFRMDSVHYDEGSEDLVKSSTEYSFIRDGSAIRTDTKVVPSPSWIERMCSKEDLFINPHNADAWEHLGGEVEYSSERLFINDFKHVFVNTPYGWLKVYEHWIKNNVHIPAELKDEYMMAVNLMETE